MIKKDHNKKKERNTRITVKRNTIHNRRDTLPNKSNTKQEHNKRNTIQGTQYQEQYNEHNKRKTIVGTQ
jgi:hypothetical protein